LRSPSCRTARGCGSRFFDQLVCLSVCLIQNFLPLRFGFGEFSFAFFRVRQAFSDPLAPLFEHRQHPLVRKFVKKNANDREADDLRN